MWEMWVADSNGVLEKARDVAFDKVASKVTWGHGLPESQG